MPFAFFKKRGDNKAVNSFAPFNHNYLVLLFCLCTSVAYIANNVNPDQTASSGSSLIRAHSVCFRDKMSLESI